MSYTLSKACNDVIAETHVRREEIGAQRHLKAVMAAYLPVATRGVQFNQVLRRGDHTVFNFGFQDEEVLLMHWMT